MSAATLLGKYSRYTAWTCFVADVAVLFSTTVAPSTVVSAEGGRPPTPGEVATLTTRANAGDASAQFQLGVLGLGNWLGDKGRLNAIPRLKAAASAKHNGAAYVLGMLYIRGILIDRDPVKGVRFLQATANRGDLRSKNRLALLMLRGDGIKKDPAAAVALLSVAASAGFPEAQTNLGLIYLRGAYAPRDEIRGAARDAQRSTLRANRSKRQTFVLPRK
jgi:TPR repeat protein